MTLFSKKALREVHKREQEMSSPQKTLKAARTREIRREVDKTAAKDKSKAKTAADKRVAAASF